MSLSHYIGRFAPSPTGPLHAGSLAAALGSWLDARAHSGQWLVRMEDVDFTRCKPAWAQQIAAQLRALGLHSDAPVLRQSQRSAAYAQALGALQAQGLAYACTCTRADIALAYAQAGREKPRFADWVYPGTCRAQGQGVTTSTSTTATAWRLAVPTEHSQHTVHWHDRALGAQQQNVAQDVGDFVLRRADGAWSYQLAVVLDDAAQGVTHVVRGADLADNTARQLLLQRALCLPTPQYLHLPLVLGADGQKLSKQNGAAALDLSNPQAVLQALNQAAQALGLAQSTHTSPERALTDWTAQWANRWRGCNNPALISANPTAP